MIDWYKIKISVGNIKQTLLETSDNKIVEDNKRNKT